MRPSSLAGALTSRRPRPDPLFLPLADPRISLGVPIIGSPSTHSLLSHRAANLPAPAGPLPLAPPYFPASLVALFAREDPACVPLERWDGRKVLVLSGEDDALVNYVHGGSEAFVGRLENEAKGCKVEAWVQPKTCVLLFPPLLLVSSLRPSSSALPGRLRAVPLRRAPR